MPSQKKKYPNTVCTLKEFPPGFFLELRRKYIVLESFTHSLNQKIILSFETADVASVNSEKSKDFWLIRLL